MAGMGLAYWISPSGKVLEPTMYHIGSIVSNPEKFGETDETIKKTFDKHKEPVSERSEGKARNEIMDRVMSRGFIRIRKFDTRRMQQWSIELYNLISKKVDYIAKWAKWMIDTKQAKDVFADVVITDLKNFHKIQNNLALVSKGVMESASRTINKRTIVYEIDLKSLAESVDIIVPIDYIKECDISKWDDYVGNPNSTINKIDEYLSR